MLRTIIALISGLTIFSGIYLRYKNYKTPRYYTSCLITAICFAAPIVGLWAYGDYTILNHIGRSIDKFPLGIFIIFMASLYAVRHLNERYMFTSIALGFYSILLYSFILFIAILLLVKSATGFAIMIVTTCLFFVAGVVHTIIGPILSGYTIATLIWLFYSGEYSSHNFFAIWPSFFDFISIESRPIECVIMIISIVLGLSDSINDVQHRISEIVS